MKKIAPVKIAASFAAIGLLLCATAGMAAKSQGGHPVAAAGIPVAAAGIRRRILRAAF